VTIQPALSRRNERDDRLPALLSGSLSRRALTAGKLRLPSRRYDRGDTAADNDEAATPRFIPGPLLCAYRMAMNDLVIPRNRSRSIIASGKRLCISEKLSNSASSTATMASSSVAAFE
jgi:hypothetical protein